MAFIQLQTLNVKLQISNIRSLSEADAWLHPIHMLIMAFPYAIGRRAVPTVNVGKFVQLPGDFALCLPPPPPIRHTITSPYITCQSDCIITRYLQTTVLIVCDTNQRLRVGVLCLRIVSRHHRTCKTFELQLISSYPKLLCSWT
jgi:hypothetical protein